MRAGMPEAATPGGPDSTGIGTSSDTKIRGLILAAGRGNRLGGAAEAIPKCLLEVGRRSIAEHQLSALADAGIGPTAIVVGYAAAEVRDALGIRAEYITNSRWNTTNSLYSFWLAREWLRGPAVVLNSDVLFPTNALERLLDVEGDALLYDSSSGHAREQMKVEVVQGRLVDIGKDLPASRVSGENVGIVKLTSSTLAEVMELAGRLIEEGHEKGWLGTAIREIARRGSIRAVDMSDVPWIEIDFPIDLVRARKEIWPRIRRPLRSRLRPAAIAAGLVLLLATLLAFVGFRGPVAERTWETLPVDSATHELVLLGEMRENWWMLDQSSEVEVIAGGPGPVRIDTRRLDPPPEASDYVLEVSVDGERHGWFSEDTRPSRSRTHPRWVIGRRRRVELDLDPGVHRIRVGLVAPVTARCLIRIRSLDQTVDDESLDD